jgi:hypothetical protein
VITLPTSIDTTALVLRLVALRGITSYLTLLVLPGAAASVLGELEAEVRIFAEGVSVEISTSSHTGLKLLKEAVSIKSEVWLVNAEAFNEEDWRLLDRRRSELARDGITVLITTSDSFDALMRVAPNLASWLGGSVFSYEDLDTQAMQQREQRLAALRKWSGKTDDDILREVAEGRLPRDPEYAEWLILLGRGELLNA